MSITVDGPLPGPFRWSLVVSEHRDDLPLADALERALRDIDDRSGTDGSVQLWIREVDAEADSIASSLGFRRYRDLWQLRCALPNRDSGLVTRAFTPADLDDFVGVNNRAFRWHPEQGGLTRESVEATMLEPWFDAEGFRLLHEGDELVGFCWTKIHRDVEPNLGEIYVIAVDPSRHGMGLGKPMTLAGLEWLADQGLEHGMLYVESDNDPANATYASIGFSRHHTDRAYELDQP
ncbi:MAG: mycothiol synthase [Actinomycetota bacterium]